MPQLYLTLKVCPCFASSSLAPYYSKNKKKIINYGTGLKYLSLMLDIYTPLRQHRSASGIHAVQTPVLQNFQRTLETSGKLL